MKIGILTFIFSRNYGAFLQAYALKKTVQLIGHEAEFINYVPTSRNSSVFKGWGLLSGIKMISIIKKRLKFEHFRYSYLPSTRACHSQHDLKNIAKKYDAIIVGSDQVWNGHLNKHFEGTYFLDFLNSEKCRRISYAACFGDPSQPQYLLNNIGELLEKFDHISVRNKMSAGIVRKFVKNKTEIVLDPTMLYSFNEFIKKRYNNNKYIAVYYLTHEHLEEGRKVLKTIKNKLGLPLITFSKEMKIDSKDVVVFSAGPIDWLEILKNASFILTNSFHGTVFSVKFKKPFISWSLNTSDGFRGPARLIDFLDQCGLKDRLIQDYDERQIDDLINNPINYSIVTDKLSNNIERSINFLMNALK